MWCSPTACIGEFDSLEGPRLKYAYEYFDYQRSSECHNLTQMVAFVGGDMLVGRAVASGRIHANYEAYMRSIASRALVSNDSREESVIFQEPGGPVIGSICFSISDILARGEKRRFCLVFMHSSFAQLVARWNLISSFSRLIIDDATLLASARQDREYETFADLERRREEARRKPLRSLMELMAAEHETEQDVALKLHCYFEVGLPAIFSSPITSSLTATGQDDAAALTSAFRATIDEQLPFAQLYVEHIDVDEDVPVGMALVPEYAKNLLFPEEEVVVKPLTAWLTDFFSRDSARPMCHLLDALFSGNQVLISSTDPMDGVNFALSLTHVMPPSLSRWSVLAEEYVMPYTAQIVSFGPRFLSTHEIVAHSSPSSVGSSASPLSLGSPKELLVLEELGDKTVHVNIQGGRIDSILWCDRAASTVPSYSTLATRCVSLVEKACASSPSHTVPTATLRLLTTQVEQLVAEYVVRGGVYTAVFREQEVEANKDALGVSTRYRLNAAVMDGTYIAKILSLFRSSSSQTTQRQHAESNSGQRPRSLEKQPGLRKESGAPFTKERFVFSSFSETDHATLIFLGQASTISLAR